jgi:hypothetical protein
MTDTAAATAAEPITLEAFGPAELVMDASTPKKPQIINMLS